MAVSRWKVPQSSPCSWWWRCKTPRYRCRGIRWAWSRPPPWSPPNALCWLNAACAAEPGLRPSAAPSPTPPFPSPLVRNQLERLQDRLLERSPVACPQLTPKNTRRCTISQTSAASNTFMHTYLELHTGRELLQAQRPAFSCEFLWLLDRWYVALEPLQHCERNSGSVQ